MKRIKILSLSFLLVISVLLSACGIKIEEEVDVNSCPNFYCPTISENTTFDKYKKLKINNFGRDHCAYVGAGIYFCFFCLPVSFGFL